MLRRFADDIYVSMGPLGPSRRFFLPLSLVFLIGKLDEIVFKLFWVSPMNKIRCLIMSGSGTYVLALTKIKAPNSFRHFRQLQVWKPSVQYVVLYSTLFLHELLL